MNPRGLALTILRTFTFTWPLLAGVALGSVVAPPPPDRQIALPPDCPADVKEQIVKLYDDDPQVRREAYWALARMWDRGAPALPRLIELLADKGEVRGSKVVGEYESALYQMSEVAVVPLARALKHPNLDIRRGAARTLESMRAVHATDALIEALADSDADVRWHAAWALAAIKNPRALRPLIAAMRDKDWNVRVAAAGAAAEFGAEAADAVPSLIEILADVEGAVAHLSQREAARYSPPHDDPPRVGGSLLVKIGGPAVPPLLAILQDKSQDLSLRKETVNILRQIKDRRAVGPLIGLLDDADSRGLRVVATETLGELKDPEAVKPLVALLKDGAPDVRCAAVDALGKIADRGAVEPMLAMLKDPDTHVRVRAMAALASLPDARAGDSLLGELEDSAFYVRAAAARALGHVGNRRAIEPLIARLRDEHARVQEAAIESLGMFADPRAVEPLLAMFPKADTAQYRIALVVALGRLKDVRAAESLAKIFQDIEQPKVDSHGTVELTKVRIAAAAALGEIKAAGALPVLVAALRDERQDIRDAAEAAIAAIGEPAIELFRPDLKSEGVAGNSSRYRALRLLSKIHHPRAVEIVIAQSRANNYDSERFAIACGELRPPLLEPLLAGLKSENALVRQFSALALGRTRDPRCIEPLLAALDDKVLQVRYKAAGALACIGRRGFDLALAATNDKHADLRSSVVRAPCLVGDPDAVKLLRPLLKDRDPAVRSGAAWKMGALHAADVLVAALTDGDDDPQVRETLIESLSWLKTKVRTPEISRLKAPEALFAALKDPSEIVRGRAARALGIFRDRRAVEPLIAACGDPSSYVRQHAVSVLARFRDPRGFEPLLAALKDSDARVRHAALGALAVQKDLRAMEALRTAAEDADRGESRDALRALQELHRVVQREDGDYGVNER